MSNPLRPLTDEERAAKEARLAQLRAQMSGSGNSSAVPNHAQDQNHHVSQDHHDNTLSNNGFQNSNDAYSPIQERCSSDDDEDECDSETEFLRQIEQGSGAAGVHVYKMRNEEMLGQTITARPGAHRSTVGDFELLRLAKMGDSVSFAEFSTLMGINPVTFRDNHDRNALHYAADSGDVAMLQYLVDMRVPFLRDEKRMSPLDIAVLNRHAPAVRLLASAFPEAAASAAQTHEAAVEAFAPPPPRFTVSKAAPRAEADGRPRAFWAPAGGGEAAAAARPAPEGFAVAAVAPADAARRGAVEDALCRSAIAGDGPGLLAWLPPAERATLRAALARAFVVCAAEEGGAEANAESKANAKAVVGAVLAVPLGGRLVARRDALASAPLLVAQLALTPAARGSGVAAAMLSALEREVAAHAVVFRSAQQLLVKAVGLIKWSRRSVDPCSVFAQKYVEEVFPDFFQYDGILRADIIAKNAMSNAFRAKREPHKMGWCAVERNNAEQVQQLYSFIREHAESTFALAYVPDTVDDMLATIMADGLLGFVYVSPETGSITDFVVLRLRRPEITVETDNKDDGDGDSGKRAEVPPTCLCVYALFNSFTGPDKAEEIFFLAALLKCETLLVPNMFGFTDSDLSKANFEELLKLREYLYVLKDKAETLVAPMTPFNVGIPCAFL